MLLVPNGDYLSLSGYSWNIALTIKRKGGEEGGGEGEEKTTIWRNWRRYNFFFKNTVQTGSEMTALMGAQQKLQFQYFLLKNVSLKNSWQLTHK